MTERREETSRLYQAKPLETALASPCVEQGVTLEILFHAIGTYEETTVSFHDDQVIKVT